MIKTTFSSAVVPSENALTPLPNSGQVRLPSFTKIENMTPEFFNWLRENDLSELFATAAGDQFFVNVPKRIVVIKKKEESGTYSFYFEELAAFEVYDDEKKIIEYTRGGMWRTLERSTRFSTNEVYVKLHLNGGREIKLQVFKASKGSNIERDSSAHVVLLNYTCMICHLIYKCAEGASI